MKRFFLICLFFVGAASSAFAKKTVCLNMIIKDETAVITRCLESCKPMIDYWVIVDTGSTDGTQDMVLEVLEGIPGELHERPWINFGHNRNEALQLAKGKGDYLLFIDADEEFLYDDDFVMPDLTLDYYDVAIKFGGSHYYRRLVVNNSYDWKWIGVIHEYLTAPGAHFGGILEGVTDFVRAEGARSQDPDKFIKDAKLLEDALIVEPENERYVFYLAQSYRDAGEFELAFQNYEKRIEMGGWNQEVFWSKFQLGQISQWMGADADESLRLYNDAYQYRPSRAEPLYYMAKLHRLQGDYLIGYLLAGQGMRLGWTKDNLFVQKWVYDWGLMFERSISAFWIDEMEESRDLCLELLARNDLPQDVRKCVERNLKHALNGLGY